MDKGLLLNMKLMFINPQKFIHSYIKGKRKNILNPISFLILSITIYLIIEAFFKVSKSKIPSNANFQSIQSTAYNGGKVFRAYFNYFWILFIIPLSGITRMLFKRYSYPEHLVINAVVMGQATLLCSISYILSKRPLMFDPVLYITLAVLIFRIFNRKNNTFETISLTLITLLFFTIILFGSIYLMGVFLNV
ncbi:hypothetical protein WH52_08145 [Tenacibaculum holothuriorum]|uniref:Yip1 domain-containing protein n=2 Tax=Tenacibaculum holothuriorum TaxID=1635173 RepID=A0A1Y2PC10_9FLAO|nr:hypothetical protein WH52_08145 [Tenacibaculum holothuriorum]